ncbi:hypothetical protein ACMHYJ_00175 [Castellaniella hirudinis]|uniref:hypothetical protein n=1 Tax=Castellaniella hirudinis TaxID=1144617 RepID=UPI0039C39012
MPEKLLITRLAGLGDVASILIPAVSGLSRAAAPDTVIDVLTYDAGIELMDLVPIVTDVLGITPEQWPRDLTPAMESFTNIARFIASRQYDRIICLDTWFMPCFLAQVLKDAGFNVEGNHLDRSISDLNLALGAGKLDASYFSNTRYMRSTYPKMSDWQQPWWLKPHTAAHYPEYYLNHCCGFTWPVDIRLRISPDPSLRQAVAGKKIIALSTQGSAALKHYKQAEQLTRILQSAGYHVWSRFDGSQPMATTLGQLAATDLLITVPTSTQWLAKLVGCPSLMIPGAMHPDILGAEYTIAQSEDCQYCCQTGCPAGRNYACMDIPAQQILEKVQAILG